MARKRGVDAQAGMLYGIPLGDGRYGVALVSSCLLREAPYDGWIYLYGFDRLYPSLPGPNDVGPLGISNVRITGTCYDVGIRKKWWPLIGAMPGFTPEDWPVVPSAIIWPQPRPRPRGEFKPNRIYIDEEGLTSSAILKPEDVLEPGEVRFLPLNQAGVMIAQEVLPWWTKYNLDPYEPGACWGSPEALAVWKRIIQRAKDKGLYPLPKVEDFGSAFDRTVEVRIVLHDPGTRQELTLEDIDELDEKFEAAFEGVDFAEFDGRMTGGGQCVFTFYGNSTDRILYRVRKILKGRKFPTGSEYWIREGPRDHGETRAIK